MDIESASYAIGSGFEYREGRCNQLLINWYMLFPLDRCSAVKVLKIISISSVYF